MVKLLTEPVEAASGTGRVPGPGNPRPAVHDFSGPANLFKDVIETKNENATSRPLASLAFDLLDPSAVDAELRSQGFGGLSAEQEAALTSAGTDAAKFRAIHEQRERSRSANLRRLVRQRQFIAENPLLVEEALTIYGNTTGEAPGKTLDELELDPLGREAAEANPVAIYQQGVTDAAVDQGLSPALPFEQLEHSVQIQRRALTEAAYENARWQALDSRAKVDEQVTLDHFMVGTYPVFVDEMLRQFNTLVIPEGSAEKQTLIQELEREFTEVRAQYDQLVGIRGQQNQAYVSAMANMRSFLDVKIAEINGETLTDIEKNFHDRLKFASDNLYHSAQLDSRSRFLITDDGQPVSGADLEIAIQRFNNMDIKSLIELSIGGIKFKDMIGQNLTQMGLPVDMGTTAIRDYTDEQADAMFNFAIGTARAAARGVGSATPQEAIDGMRGYFGNYNVATHVPETVRLTVLKALGDIEVSAFLKKSGYDLLDQTLVPTSDYVTNTIQIFNNDLEEFESNVSVTETPNGEGVPLVSVSFTPKGGMFGGTVNQTQAMRRAHKGRLEALIRARMIWRGGTAQEALDEIMSGVTGRQYFNRPQTEQEAP